MWRRSWTSLTDLFYWPLLDLMLFGLLATYLSQRQGIPLVVGLLVGALILWDIFFRVQQAISVSFLMELWSQNLLNLFVSPLSLTEFLVAMMLFGLIKIAVTTTLLVAVAWALYHFNIFTLGLALVPFIVGLILFGWAIGTMATGIILRLGPTAETLAWSLAFLFQPFGAVFFPMSTYPEWLQRVLWLLPLPHVFEGMRAVLHGGSLDPGHLVWAYALDAVYLVAAFAFFGMMFRLARRRGSLLRAYD